HIHGHTKMCTHTQRYINMHKNTTRHTLLPHRPPHTHTRTPTDTHTHTHTHTHSLTHSLTHSHPTGLQRESVTSMGGSCHAGVIPLSLSPLSSPVPSCAL